MVQKRKSATVRQTQIIDAARKVIVKYGSEHVTIKRIAKEVGISEANIYRHFKNKKQILSLLIAEIEESLLGDFQREADASGHQTLETLEGLLQSHLSAVAQKRGITFQVIAEIISLGDKRLNKMTSAAINTYISRVKELLLLGVQAGEISPDLDLEAAATLFFSSVQGLVNIWALSNHIFSLEDRYASIWRVLRNALVRAEAEPGKH